LSYLDYRTAPERLTKTPTEVKVFNFDFSAHFTSPELIGSIASNSVTPTGEVVIDSTAFSGTAPTAQVITSGGVSGTTYRITLRVVSTEGQEIQAVGILRVGDA
jgi:hypothetical protein